MLSREIDRGSIRSRETSVADEKEFSTVGMSADLGIPCSPQPPCTTPPCRGCKPCRMEENVGSR